MSAIPRIELCLTEDIGIDCGLAVESRRRQVSIVQIHDNDVLIMKMHRRRLAGGPGKIPHDNPWIVENHLRSFARKRIGIAARVRQRRDLDVLQFDDDGMAGRIRDAFLHLRVSFLVERDLPFLHGIHTGAAVL